MSTDQKGIMNTEDAIRAIIGQDAPQGDVENVAITIMVSMPQHWPEPNVAAIVEAARVNGLAVV